MKKKLPAVLLLILFLASCGSAPRQEEAASEDEKKAEKTISETERAFLGNLASLCGQSFPGEETYMEEGRESWADKEMVMHVTVCEENHVHIPFHINDDESRTWMFLVDNGKLRFRHDHRYPDGTPEEQTLYGGYADGTGTAFSQHFPADDYTIELLEDTLNRQWNVVLDEELSSFSYQLQYHGEVVFRADFDLTNPL